MNKRKIQCQLKLSAWSAGKRGCAKRDRASLSSLTVDAGFDATHGCVGSRDATNGGVCVCQELRRMESSGDRAVQVTFPMRLTMSCRRLQALIASFFRMLGAIWSSGRTIKHLTVAAHS